MGKLIIEFSLVPVDMGTKPDIKIARLNIKNQHAIKILIWSVTTTGARAELEINDRANKYVKKLLSFPPYAGSFLFGISFSMENPNILFSPLYWDFLNATVEEERPQGSPPNVYEARKVDVINTQVEINEVKVFDIVEKLFYYKYSASKSNSLFEKNIKESINSYQLALISTNIYTRFTFLFHSFEKAVNADGEDRRGKSFDEEASELTKIERAKIKDVRIFYDRIKHAFGKAEDILTLESGIKNFSQLALDLKTATDNAILARISNTKP